MAKIRNYTPNTIVSGTSSRDDIDNYASYVTISGAGGNDDIDNEADNVSINGGSGNDEIDNVSANVTIIGGSGNDEIDNEGSNVTMSGGKGNDTLINGYDIEDNEYEVGEGAKALLKYAKGDGDDIIYGFRADSTLSIGGGTYSTTKNGSDIIVTVGEGKISLIGAADLSDINIDGEEEVATKTLTITNKTASPVKVDSDISIIDASKRTKAIKITANALDNKISGGSKADTIYGGAGNDSIVGNAGNDFIYGGFGKDTLKGGKGNDVLIGGSGDDKIYGGNGNDYIDAGTGNDSLWGNAGADEFIYNSGDGKDVIFGFDSQDTLTLDIDDFKASYSKKNGTITLTFDEGSVKLKEFGTNTTFHINNDVYKISGSKFKKQ